MPTPTLPMKWVPLPVPMLVAELLVLSLVAPIR